MIAAFLLPFPVRAVRAPYLWVFYKLLSAYEERTLYLLGEDYVGDPHDLAASGRWEPSAKACKDYGYRVPEQGELERHSLRFIPDEIFSALLREHLGNPIAVFRKLLTQRVPLLEAAIDGALSAEIGAGARIEAVVTWCNCPSLVAAAERHGIPVVHLEVGPLRAPEYRPTAYFDFAGVNGGTEACARYSRLGGQAPALDIDAMRDFFCAARFPAPGKAHLPVGAALQVEDDSNLVAYSNGYDNQSLIAYSKLQCPAGTGVVVRSHPGSSFQLKPGHGFELDTSPDSIAFVRACSRVITINSSVGLEAILWGVPVTVLGDTSYSFVLAARDRRELHARLAFYLFAYLVPRALLFDPGYLRFRLTRPSESQIVSRHLAEWGCGNGTHDQDAGDDPWALIARTCGATGRRD